MQKMTREYRCSHCGWSKKVTSGDTLFEGMNTFSMCPKCHRPVNAKDVKERESYV